MASTLKIIATAKYNTLMKGVRIPIVSIADSEIEWMQDRAVCFTLTDSEIFMTPKEIYFNGVYVKFEQ
ncbi:MAG: hypothetical protein ACEQSL_01605 [Sediminibacterium sp.]